MIADNHLNIFRAIDHDGVLLCQADGPELQRGEDGRWGVDVISVGGAGAEESGGQEPAGLDGQWSQLVHPPNHVSDSIDVGDVGLLIHHWDVAPEQEVSFIQ